jgi:hypothetical protein
MDLEMVLNELSLHPLATNVHDARERMAVLVQLTVGATRRGVKGVLRTYSNFNIEELAPNYPVVKWLNDAQVDRESRRFFLTIATKSPFLVDITDKSVLENFGLSDYFFGEKHAIGLGIAFLLDALSVSLRSDPCWFESHLQLRVSQIDDDGDLTDVFEDILHTSTIEHINMHLSWINKRLQVNAQSDVHEGSDIWLHKEEWFPHLYFCEQVREQLVTLSRGHLMLMPILKRLYELEDYCDSWLDGSFDYSKIVSKATPESAVTLEMYSSERTFLCHDDVFRVFSWHLRLTPGAWRLYFYPLPEVHKLIIGYIGSHLSTMLHAH